VGPSRTVVIVNPRARGCGALGWREAVERELAPLGPLRFIVPTDPEGTRLASRDCLRDAVRLIVVAGGDGTINQVVNGSDGLPCDIGILPCGTANDLARHLDLPLHPVDAARAIVAGHPRPVDVLTINAKRCCTVGGLALVAQSALLVNILDSGPPWMGSAVDRAGPIVYRLSAAANILLRRDIRQSIRVELSEPPASSPRTVELRCHGVFIANQATLGAGLTLPLASRNDDGVVELAVLNAGGRWRLLRTLSALAAGVTPPGGAVSAYAASSMRIEYEQPTVCFGDGEWLGCARVFQIGVERGALRVRVPAARESRDPVAAANRQRVGK